MANFKQLVALFTLSAALLCISNGEFLGEQCDADLTCSIDVDSSVCRNDICVCATTHVQGSGNERCYRRRLINNGFCEIDEQCIPNSKCLGELTSKRCKCVEGFMSNEVGNLCEEIIPLKLGDPCRDPLQCQIENSKCGGEAGKMKCECVENFIPNALNSECLKLASNIGDSCEIQQQCTLIQFAECNSLKKCNCFTTHVNDDSGTKCLVKRFDLDDTCEISRQCQLDGTECSTEKACKCSDGRIRFDGQCLQKINTINVDECSTSEQCPENAGCLLNDGKEKCQCNGGYIVNNAQNGCLIVRASLGEECKEKEQCKVANSDCLGGICSCTSGFVSDLPAIKDTCYEERQNLEDSCTINKQCKVLQSYCKDLKCTCNPEYVAKNKNCYKRVNTIENEICEFGEQCPQNSACLNIGTDMKCKCSDGFVKLSNGTACLKVTTILGGPCLADNQCNIDNAQCQGGKCICNEMHVANGNVCLKRLTSIEAEICVASVQCPSNSICIELGNVTSCRCSNGFVKNQESTMCLEKRSLGQVCQIESQCELADNNERVECRGGSCMCKAPYKPDAGRNVCRSDGARIGVAVASLVWMVLSAIFIL